MVLLNKKPQEAKLVSKFKSSIIIISIELLGCYMFISCVRQEKVVPIMKSKVELYLDEPMYILNDNGYDSF